MMMKFWSSLATLMILCSCNKYAQINKQMKAGSLNLKQLYPTVVWKHFHFSKLAGGRQYINLLEIDLNDSNVTVGIAYSDTALLPTSVHGTEANAIAAVNGSFFHTTEGGSVCYFRSNKKLINKTRTELNEDLFLPWLDQGAVAWNDDNTMAVVRKPARGWASFDSAITLLSAGPLLIYQGRKQRFAKHSFNNSRFSRTAVGITSRNRLILLTVDGNSGESKGMTMKQLARVFKVLHCVNALNLDGGGSTTMWIRGEPDNGVVNHPTDNKRFDHAGERRVANCLYVKLKSTD